jgi:hypothetical protein
VGTAKRDRTKAPAGHDGHAPRAAEAEQLIAGMRRDLQVITEMLADEQQALGGRNFSSKRLARLRLMSDDLSSARKFATKSVK